MPTKQSTRRAPVKKNTRASKAVEDVGGDFVNVITSEEIDVPAPQGKKVVAGKGRGKGKAVVAEKDANEDLIGQRKGTKKKVTFSIENSNNKGKGKVVEEEEENEESAKEEADEDKAEDDIEEDHVDAAVKMAVNVGKSALKKKTVAKLREVTKERPLEAKALGVVKGKAEAGEGSKKRKGDESSIMVAKKKKEVDGHGSPRQLFNMIANLTAAQKKDVEDIGFGGLLELKTHAFYHQMVDWLLHKYDPSSRMFLFNRHVQFVLTKHDVYDAFMLPCTDKPIEAKTDRVLAQIWRESFKVTKKDEISLEWIRQGMLGLPDGGADFKKMFVVFAMGTFLAPTVHNRIDFRLIKAVEDVDAIAQLDWCSLVLLRLNQAVESWRSNDTKNVGGCLMFLQMMYFHRLTWWGEPEKTSLPLVQHWTYERLKKRMAQEVAAYPHHRGFGIGVWELHTYPISKHQVKRLYRRTTEHEPASREPPSRFVNLPLPDGVQTDEELQASYNDVRVRNWMTTRRNLSVVSIMHKSLIQELAAQEGGGDQLQSGSMTSVGGEAEQSQGSFMQALDNLEFVAAWNALGEKLDALIDVEMVKSPSFSLGFDYIGVTSHRAGSTNTRSRGKKATVRKQ